MRRNRKWTAIALVWVGYGVVLCVAMATHQPVDLIGKIAENGGFLVFSVTVVALWLGDD